MKTEPFVLQPLRHLLWVGIGLMALAAIAIVGSFLMSRGALQIVAFACTLLLLLGGVYCFIRAEQRETYTCSWNERLLEVMVNDRILFTGKWDDLAGLREDEHAFILQLKDSPEPVVLPKRAMRQIHLSAFRERIAHA